MKQVFVLSDSSVRKHNIRNKQKAKERLEAVFSLLPEGLFHMREILPVLLEKKLLKDNLRSPDGAATILLGKLKKEERIFLVGRSGNMTWLSKNPEHEKRPDLVPKMTGDTVEVWRNGERTSVENVWAQKSWDFTPPELCRYYGGGGKLLLPVPFAAKQRAKEMLRDGTLLGGA